MHPTLMATIIFPAYLIHAKFISLIRETFFVGQGRME